MKRVFLRDEMVVGTYNLNVIQSNICNLTGMSFQFGTGGRCFATAIEVV